jgi:hypothetical protein
MKHTLAEALEIARAPSKEEPPALWAPKIDQAPPVTPPLGQPVPEGVVIRQSPHPDQMPLALKPLERCPTKAEHQAFDTICADMEVSRGASEADREWGFTESPELIAQQDPLPEGVYRLDDIVKEPWCRCHYKTEGGLIRFLLTPYEYPPHLTTLSLIHRIGFDALMARKREVRCGKDRERKEKDAVKQAADQGPEPGVGQIDASPITSFAASPNEIAHGKSGSG